MPAGTGVWVVKTVADRTASRASSNDIPSARTSSLIRSTPRNPACPSFGVVDVGCRSTGEPGPQSQRADPAHAEEHLLLQAKLPAATVEALGDAAAAVVVGVDVGVEEQQGHPSDLGAPHLGMQLPATGEVDGDDARVAVLLAQQREGEAVGVQDRVVLLLPAVAVEALAEVAGLVEEAHTDDRHADVRGGLEVVAGEDAEAAGVLRERRGDAELGAEVRDGRRHAALGLLARPVLVPAVLAQVAVQRLLRRHPPSRRIPGHRRGARAPAAAGRRASRRGRCRPRPSVVGRWSRRGRAAGGASSTAGSSRAHPERRSGRAGQGGR